MTTPEPQEITGPFPIATSLKFCEGVVKAINRNPNRRAKVKRDGLECQMLDYSVPIRETGHGTKKDQNVIIGWEPMEGYEQ